MSDNSFPIQTRSGRVSRPSEKAIENERQRRLGLGELDRETNELSILIEQMNINSPVDNSHVGKSRNGSACPSDREVGATAPDFLIGLSDCSGPVIRTDGAYGGPEDDRHSRVGTFNSENARIKLRDIHNKFWDKHIGAIQEPSQFTKTPVDQYKVTHGLKKLNSSQKSPSAVISGRSKHPSSKSSQTKLRLKHELEQIEMQRQRQRLDHEKRVLEREERIIELKLRERELHVKQELEKTDSTSRSETGTSVTPCSVVSEHATSNRTSDWVREQNEDWVDSRMGSYQDQTHSHANSNANSGYRNHREGNVTAECRMQNGNSTFTVIHNEHTDPEPRVEPVQNPHVSDWIEDEYQDRAASLRCRNSNRDDRQNHATQLGPVQYVTAAAVNIDLPKTELFVFDGSPLMWCEWSLNFKNRIHDNPHLTDSQRLSYLQALISEGPRSKIFGLLWDAKNYLVALREIKRIYGNPSFIVEAYIDAVKSWNTPNTPSEISEFSISVTQLVQVFRTLGFHADLKAYGLLSDLVRKLPYNMKKSWGKQVQRVGNPNVEKFESWLSGEEEALRLGGALVFRKPGLQGTIKHHSGSKGISRTVNSVGVKPKHDGYKQSTREPEKPNSKVQKPMIPHCQFCDSREHFIEKCGIFLKKSGPDRLSWYQSENRCLRCSKTGHETAVCSSKNYCRVPGCQRTKKHSAPLHDILQSSPAPSTEILNAHLTKGQCATYLQILPVKIHSPGGMTVTTYAMLDSGSQGTLIASSLARKLSLKGPERELRLRNVAKDVNFSSRQVHFRLSDPNDPSELPLSVAEAWTMGELCLPGQTIPRDPVWAYIEHLHLSDVPGHKVEILIGANCKYALKQLEVIQGPAGLPDAICTPLGWTLLGGTGDCDDATTSVNAVMTSVPEPASTFESLNFLIERFWSIDQFGCKFNDDVEISSQDRRALNILDSETRHTGSRYEVPMLWNDINSVSLLDNRSQAVSRYRSLLTKLSRNPELKSQYGAAIGKYIAAGHASKLTEEQVSMESDLVHYLVHFSVFHPIKKKCRVVFDAALPFNGKCLNDELLMGPLLTNSLVGILLRFRIGSVALSSDVEAMFHQVLVPRPHVDSLRFLWSLDLSQKPDTFRMNVHVFGAKCSPCCATYALRRPALDNVSNFCELSISAFLNSFYVDDFLFSTDSEDSAVAITQDVIHIAATGGFKLTKWVSTSPRVLEVASSSDGITTDVDLNLDESAMSRVLGIHWNVSSDQFFFKASIVDNSLVTKRVMLSQTCSIFDPLGFLSPFVIRARLLIQMLWKDKVEWDESVSDPVFTLWKKWLSELATLQFFRLNRKYWPASLIPSRTEFHFFADASERAFGACCYVRVISESDVVHVSLVMSRMRLAPLSSRTLTLPRLELQAAVLSVRMAVSIRKELHLKADEEFYWSDSITTLRYIKNEERRYKPFVGNRQHEILTDSNPNSWGHCPGALNPADCLTRGLPISDVIDAEGHWLKGPYFLWGPRYRFPGTPNVDTDLDAPDPELKAPKFIAKIEIFALPITPHDFSSVTRLVRVTAWCLRFVRNARILRTPKLKLKPVAIVIHDYPLDAFELESGKKIWLKISQRESYPNEITSLGKGNVVPRDSHVLKLRPFLDEEGFLRVGGRLTNAQIPYESKHQLILSPQHRLSYLLVVDCHERILHAGVEHMVTQIRAQYWIPNLRPLARKVVGDCRVCRRFMSTPSIPKMAPLPPARITGNEPVWSKTGVDLWGPMRIKQRRSVVKRCGIIFCSMSIRSVHLDLLNSVDSDTFIMGLRRFIARRGEVTELFLDRGTNFVGAEPELRSAHERLKSDPRIKDFLSNRGIEFNFNPPKASHMGGSWERLIRSVKRTLHSVLRDRVVAEDVLCTSLCEIEAAMNSRPLSYVGDDPDHPTPLTPNHFLHHSDTIVTPMDVLSPDDDASRKKWRQSQFITDHLWKRWRKEYLPTLSIAQKWNRDTVPLSIGDVVLLCCSDSPRGIWPLAIITEVVKGRDGRIRSAVVKTKSVFLLRPASQICVLEAASQLSGK